MDVDGSRGSRKHNLLRKSGRPTLETLRNLQAGMPDGPGKDRIGRRLVSIDAMLATSQAVQQLQADVARDAFIMPYRATQATADPFCSYCGRAHSGLESDHIVARALGGGDGWHNRTPACRTCNADKGDKPFLLWLMEIGGRDAP